MDTETYSIVFLVLQLLTLTAQVIVGIRHSKCKCSDCFSAEVDRVEASESLTINIP